MRSKNQKIVYIDGNMEKKLSLVSIVSGLYLALLLAEMFTPFDSLVWVGGIREFITIPAIISQFAAFSHVIWSVFAKRRLTVYSAIIVVIFLILLGWATLFS